MTGAARSRGRRSTGAGVTPVAGAKHERRKWSRAAPSHRLLGRTRTEDAPHGSSNPRSPPMRSQGSRGPRPHERPHQRRAAARLPSACSDARGRFRGPAGVV